MEEIINYWHQFLKDGGIMAWGIALGAAFTFSVLLKGAIVVASSHLKKLAEKTEGLWDDLFVECLGSTKGGVLFFWLLYLLVHIFETNETLLKLGKFSVVLASLYQGAVWGFAVLHHWREHFLLKKAKEDQSAAAAVGLIFTIVKVLFLVTLVLIGLSNLGVDIAALLAGLGVGGIAIALAAQNILGDLLASLSIVLDKTFVVGDVIKVGEEIGTVEHVGLKTTRVRSVTGEELVFSNKDLLESRIRNYKRMWERRGIQAFGVTYNTPQAKLEQIPTWVRDIVESVPKARFDRCHFNLFGDSSLNFELIFWVSDSDMQVFMDCQQKILLGLNKRFAQEGVEFAFPTQTIYVEKLPRA